MTQLAINLLKVNTLSPSLINSEIRWEVDAEGDQLEYAWYIYKAGERVANYPYSKVNLLDWKPEEPGQYSIKVFVKDQYGNKISEWSAEYTILDYLKISDIKNIVPSKLSPQPIGTSITWEAILTGEEMECAWYVYKEEERVDYISYSKNHVFDWTPTERGTYRVKLFVRDQFGNKVSKWANNYVIL
jgi:hypothetical protein